MIDDDLSPQISIIDAEQTGSLNLFFCFRWILCSFKRELSFDATLRLWEVLWTDYGGKHFHLFVALSILEAHRDVMIRYLREFDEVSRSPLVTRRHLHYDKNHADISSA